MLKLKLPLAVLLISFLISSCATVLYPQKESVMLVTEPGDAEVYDDANKKLGNTPYDLRKLPAGVKSITVSKEGYESSTVGITRKDKSGLLFLDAMLLCIPCPFDLKSGSLDEVQKLDGTLRLRKKLQEKDRSVIVAIGKPSIDIPDGRFVGTLNNSKKKINDKDINRIIGYVDETDDVIISGTKSTYLEANRISVLNDDKSNIIKPKLIITPVIKNLDFNIQGKYVSKYKGSSTVECIWNVYKTSNKDKSIATFPVKTSVFRIEGNSSSILDALMAENVRDLLENDTLYDFLVNAEREYLAETKGNVFKIKAPAKPNYKTSKEVLKGSIAGVVTVEQKDGFGSGVIISSDGYLITNYHVVDEEKNVKVKLNADVKLNAVVVKTNKDYDLALLKIDASDLKALSFGNSEMVEIGDDVWAIGTPMATDLGQSITKGIVSGFRENNGLKFIQSDVSINPGNSGGPLINDKGEIIGITTLKISGKGIEGLGFCIPSNYVIEFLNLKFE